MNKAKDALILALIGLIIAPLNTILLGVAISVPVIGIILCVVVVIAIAHLIDRQRKEHYPEMNVALFTVCVYLPGLIAGIIFCMVMFTRQRSPGDINGWGALAGGVLGILVLLSQAAMSVAGIVYALKAHICGHFDDDYFDDEGE